MQVESFSDSSEHRRWESLVGLSHHVRARTSNHVFEELSAEENRFKKMTVTGLLRSTRTLDIESVKVEG
jgi:hypothetical protein